ncbi:MAG: hypothetical protein ACOYXT_11835 [Bacteroidota bacterium]
MALKLLRSIWVFSVLTVLAGLLYVYAGLPEVVVVQEDGSGQISIDREAFFYVFLGIAVIVNVLVYVVAKFFAKEEEFRAWFHGLIVTVNVFLIIALNLVSLYNSTEKFRYESIGFILYGSIILMIVWAATWPIYSFFRKNTAKQQV